MILSEPIHKLFVGGETDYIQTQLFFSNAQQKQKILEMDFHNLEEYYDYVESDTNFKHLDFNTSKYITVLRDKTDNENLKKIYSYELFFSDFSIEQGVHIPIYQSSVNSYPTLELFDDNFEYIKSRAKQIQNPKYKAKYNHLLWLSPQKKIDFAKQAIENYLLLLQNSSFAVDDNSQNDSFTIYFENLFVLCQTVNYKKDEVIQYLVSLLETDKLNDITKYSLMNFIIENGKKIESSITQTFFDYSKKSIENLESRVLEFYLNLLVILSQKLKISTSEFHEKLGDYHISQLKTEENQGFIAHHYYRNALEEYKKAKNKEKIEKTAVLLEQSKKSIDLKKVSFEVTDDKINNALNKWWEQLRLEVTDLIENNDSNVIYKYLIVKNILPNAEILKEDIRPITFDFISTTTFDINKNVYKSKSGLLNNYSSYINNFSIRHIWLVVSNGIKSGKISFENLIDYLKNNSWYGQDFTYVDKNNETQGFNWIELLSPSLQSFFIQIEIEIKTNKHNAVGYIMSLDSFVLKFEGLLREFSKIIGAQTIEIKENATEERTNFDKLLDNDKLRAMISEDDIAYFKFLFTAEGLNLRNNIAHCFYTTKNYNSTTMLLLIVALLRLGDYKLKTT